jgi:hypothetical protein
MRVQDKKWQIMAKPTYIHGTILEDWFTQKKRKKKRGKKKLSLRAHDLENQDVS